MKLFYALALLLVISAAGYSHAAAQGGDDVLDNVVQGLVYGEVDEIARYFGERVEITLFNNTSIHSATQARHVLSQFFQEYPPRTFNSKHVGRTGNTVYMLGEYASQSGTFDVNVFVKTSANGSEVDKIRLVMR